MFCSRPTVVGRAAAVCKDLASRPSPGGPRFAKRTFPLGKLTSGGLGKPLGGRRPDEGEQSLSPTLPAPHGGRPQGPAVRPNISIHFCNSRAQRGVLTTPTGSSK